MLIGLLCLSVSVLTLSLVCLCFVTVLAFNHHPVVVTWVDKPELLIFLGFANTSVLWTLGGGGSFGLFIKIIFRGLKDGNYSTQPNKKQINVRLKIFFLIHTWFKCSVVAFSFKVISLCNTASFLMFRALPGNPIVPFWLHHGLQTCAKSKHPSHTQASCQG